MHTYVHILLDFTIAENETTQKLYLLTSADYGLAIARPAGQVQVPMTHSWMILLVTLGSLYSKTTKSSGILRPGSTCF